MRDAIARVWWRFVLRGVVAVLFGVLVDGVASVFQAFSVRNETDTWWLLLGVRCRSLGRVA